MKKTLATAIASAIVFLLLVFNTAFNTNFEIPQDVIESMSILIATGILWFISHYYNQDYSAVARKMTPIMRKVKELEKAGDLRLLDQIEHVIDEWEADDHED